MIFPSLRKHLVAMMLGATLLMPALAQTVLQLPAARALGTDLRPALAIPPSGHLRLERLPLGDQSGEWVSAELRRTTSGDTSPLLNVHSGSTVTQERPAPRAHFTGHLTGDPDSSVFVSIDSQGAMRSVVRRAGEVFVSDMSGPNGASASGTAGLPDAGLRSRRVDFAADAPARPFACGVNDEFIKKNSGPPSSALLANLRNNDLRAKMPGTGATTTAAVATLRRADIIIETDYELFQLLGSSNAVHAYVTDLMGYVSSQYESEIGARLNVTQINVYTSISYPWTSDSTSSMLTQLKDHWNQPSRFSQPRHHVHLLSARHVGGGIAYVNTLDGMQKENAYGVSSGIEGGFSASSPQLIWDSKVIAHELGHAFGSDHTHNYDAPYFGSTQGGAIDCCYSENSGQCSTQLGGAPRYGVLPGIGSTTGGSAGTGAGTIMSYCHLLTTGLSNISFSFGTNHTRGVNPWRVANVLQSSAQTYLPLDGAVQNRTLSLSRLGTGSGTVTSTPAGIDCGSTCTASYAEGTSVTLTAQAATGSIFNGWSGACSGTVSSCSVDMDSDRSVSASFTAAPIQRLITLTKAGTGTGTVTSSPSGLSCTAGCGSASASFASNTDVTLVAQAASGSTFAGWSGTCTGTGSCTIAAGASSASVTASFNSSNGSGSTVTALSKTSLSGATGSLQTFSVTLPAGATNLKIQTSGGTGDADLYVRFGQAPTLTLFDCGSFAYGNNEVCEVPFPNIGTYHILLEGYEAFTGVSLTASYQTGTLQNHALTVTRQGTGSGTITSAPAGINCGSTCTASYSAGTTVTLSARASAGSAFAGWSGACTGTSSNCSVSMGSARSVTASFNTSNGSGPLPDPVVFVTQQYQDFLGRTPDSSGLNYWVTRLNDGSATRAQVIESMMYSSEFRGRFGPLVRLYTAYFQRVPDYTGLMYWYGVMYPTSGSPTSLAQVSNSFAQSSEFVGTYGSLDNAGFVTLVYQNVLGRAPDAAGYNYWLGQLNSGISRGQVMTSFSESTENQNATANALLITMGYVGMLRRSPDTVGYTWWLNEVNAGRTSVLSLITGFLNSPEYAARF